MNLRSFDHLKNDPTCKKNWSSTYHDISKRLMITWQTSNTMEKYWSINIHKYSFSKFSKELWQRFLQHESKIYWHKAYIQPTSHLRIKNSWMIQIAHL